MAPIKTILHITPFFPPNIGGVETHLSDLTGELSHQNYQQIVLTYTPLSTETIYKSVEKSTNITIRRFYLYGHNIFHRLEKYPLINFLYITPCLLIYSIIWLMIHRPKIDTIHSHGLNGAIIGNIIKVLFNYPRHVTSIYSTYDNIPLNNLSTKILISTLNHTDHVLTQTQQSISQLTQLGLHLRLVTQYHHWIDLHRFKPLKKKNKDFSVLFIGRLIPSKNAILLAKIASEFPKIKFNFVGTGPDLYKLQELSILHQNIIIHGDVKYINLHRYYQSNSVLCLPSRNLEGWGRVLAESVACGTPVICSNLGGTTEAVDSTVAVIIPPTKENFIKAIQELSNDHNKYQELQNNCRHFATKHYSSDNLKFITRYY